MRRTTHGTLSPSRAIDPMRHVFATALIAGCMSGLFVFAVQFTAASLATNAVFWLVLGAPCGGIYTPLGRRGTPLFSHS
ncbi:MAG TPA: hypothetical protein VF502_10160 [Stellaceae bacterium]